MKLQVFDNSNSLYRHAADIFLELLNCKPNAVLGLATGRTPLPLYNTLVCDFVAGKADFSLTRTFNLDEYVGLGENHPQSYRYFMNFHLFQHINIDIKNTHIPNGMATDLLEECRHYEALLKTYPIDIQLLGLGENGHIGFNEPTLNPVFETHIATLTPSTIKANASLFATSKDAVDPLELVPKKAITMGINSILSAKKILLIATGENKAAAVYETLQGKDFRVCPSVALQSHSDVTILCDSKAAKLL